MANLDTNKGVPRSIGFKFLSGEEFYALGHCDLDLWPTDPKINHHLRVLAIPDTKKGLPRWNNFEMSGQDFANAGHIDKHTEGRTDGQRVS